MRGTARAQQPPNNQTTGHHMSRLKTLYILYYIYIYNLQNSKKFKLLAFWRKETASIDQKYTYEKLPKYLSRALPPSSGQNLVRFPDPFADGSFKVRRGPCLDKTQTTAVFSQESVPCAPRLHCFIGRALHQMDQKGQCLAQNEIKCIFFGQIWPILGQKS